MHARLQIGFWSIATIFGLAYTDGEAASNAPPAKTPAVTPTKSANHDHAMAQVLSELHQAKHLLDHANHDYNGHRAKADHEIGKAIHILHHEHHKKGTTTKVASHKGAQKGEQQVSDTQLLQAEKLVRAALLELKKHHGEKAHHASKLLHEAVHEIELAIHKHHKHHAKNPPVTAKT